MSCKENKWFLDSSIQNWSTLNVDINKYNSIWLFVSQGQSLVPCTLNFSRYQQNKDIMISTLLSFSLLYPLVCFLPFLNTFCKLATNKNFYRPIEGDNCIALFVIRVQYWVLLCRPTILIANTSKLGYCVWQNSCVMRFFYN